MNLSQPSRPSPLVPPVVPAFVPGGEGVLPATNEITVDGRRGG